MYKIVKYLAIALAGLLALLLAAAGIVAATFDPNDYKPQIIRLVQDKTQRTLTIRGEIKLGFFPRIGVDLGKLSISEHKSSAEFAAVDSAKLSLALIPLLSKQVVVDRVQVDGLHANIRRLKDGSTNFDDLLPKAEPGGQPPGGEPFRLAIDSIHLNNARVSFDDRQQARSIDIADMNLETGSIAAGVPSKLRFEARIKGSKPDIDARLSVKSGFTLEPDSKHYVLKNLDAELKGALAGFSGLALKIAGDADLDKLLFTSPQLALTLSGTQGGTAINGLLTTPLSADFKTQVVELAKIAADFSLPNPAGGTLRLQAGGNAGVNLGKRTASAVLTGSLDQSAFNARLGLSDFAPLRYTFDIGIDQLDLDRYKGKPAAASAPAKEPASTQLMDIAALRKLHANGSVRIGALKVANIKTSNVRAEIRAADGRLDVSSLAAGLYGGNVAGSLAIIAGNPARFALKQALSGIHVGPLLKDAIGKDPIDGMGNVQLDVTTAGADFDQWKKSLNGSARLELRDGAIRGVNIAQTVRNAKARIGQIRGEEAPQTGTGSANEKTDFSELSGSFRIVNGVARNDDLVVKSPLIRVAGSGDINLGEERLDYLARTTVVSTLQGQGGPELQALKGLTVPVRLSGPFNAIGWRIDFAGMASELAKQKLDERKDEVKAKAQKSLDEQKEKLREQLKEQLKGLLGK